MTKPLMNRLAVLMLCLPAAAPAARADEKTDSAKARADAARRVYESLWNPNVSQSPTGKQQGPGTPDFDQAYTWSLRWMQAQQEVSDKAEDRVAAAQAHVDRMRKMEEFVRERRRRQAATDADLAALEYYRLEAERALAEARGR